jgi:hypothetical protein
MYVELFMDWFTSFIKNCRENPALAFGILAALIAAGVFTGGAIYAPVIFAGLVTAGAVIAGLCAGWFSFAMGDKMGSKTAGLVMGAGAGLATGFSVALNPLIGMIVCGMAVSSVCGFLASKLTDLIGCCRRDSTQVSQSPTERGGAPGSSASSRPVNGGTIPIMRATGATQLPLSAADSLILTPPNPHVLAAERTAAAVAAYVANGAAASSAASDATTDTTTSGATATIPTDPEAEAAAQLQIRLYDNVEATIPPTTTPAGPSV